MQIKILKSWIFLFQGLIISLLLIYFCLSHLLNCPSLTFWSPISPISESFLPGMHRGEKTNQSFFSVSADNTSFLFLLTDTIPLLLVHIMTVLHITVIILFQNHHMKNYLCLEGKQTFHSTHVLFGREQSK